MAFVYITIICFLVVLAQQKVIFVNMLLFLDNKLYIVHQHFLR